MINLNTHIITIGNGDKQVKIDVRAMMENIYDTEKTKEAGYFNATPLAKLYGKEAHRFMELKDTKKFISIWDKKEEVGNSHSITNTTTSESSLPYIAQPKIYTSKTKGEVTYIDGVPCKVSNRTNLSYTIIGGYEDKSLQGTYMQTRLFFRFLRWLDIELEVMLDMFFMDLVANINTLKVERKHTISFFHDLIGVSDKYYVHKQPCGYPQEYANQRLMDMINIEVLGCKASTYKRKNNITSTVTRDWLTPKQLKDIKRAEAHVIGLIKYANIYDYKLLKEKLHYLMVNGE